MVYLAFDLDGTLGNFVSIWKIMSKLNELSQPMQLNENTYNSLVKSIAQAETGRRPLGIFRPGIFKLFKEIVKLKLQGKVQAVIIYTNNGYLPLVNFVRDVFHHVVNPVFDGIFYYHDKLRTKDANGNPVPSKTWSELKRLLMAVGAPDDTQTKDVMFFDDQVHTNLVDTLGKNYVKVPPYEYKVPHDRLVETYQKVLKQIVVNASDLVPLFSRDHSAPNPMNSDSMLTAIKNKLKGGKRLTRKKALYVGQLWSTY